MLEKLLGSPKKAGSPRKPGGSPTKSPEKGRNPRFPKSQDDKVSTKGKSNVHPLTFSNVDKISVSYPYDDLFLVFPINTLTKNVITP